MNSSQSQTAVGAPQDRSTTFVPVEGGDATATNAGTFMVLAYVLMWLCTVLFVLHTWRKTRGIQQRIDELHKVVSKLPQDGA
jgi:glycerol-3-phosphate acyltransferase PlsY